MNTSDERLSEFIKLYSEEFSEDISVGDAREMLIRLMTLYQLLVRPLPNEKREDR